MHDHDCSNGMQVQMQHFCVDACGLKLSFYRPEIVVFFGKEAGDCSCNGQSFTEKVRIYTLPVRPVVVVQNNSV